LSLTVAVVLSAVAVVLLTSLFKAVDWDARVKNLIATVLSVVGGVITVWATGGFENATDVLQTSLLVYGASQLLYKFVLEGTKPEASLAAVNLFGNKE